MTRRLLLAIFWALAALTSWVGWETGKAQIREDVKVLCHTDAECEAQHGPTPICWEDEPCWTDR